MNHQKNVFYYSLYRAVRNAIVSVVFSLVFVGCGGLTSTQTILPQGTTPSNEANQITMSPIESPPMPEKTDVPVSDVTNLPGHAPTNTPPDTPDETGNDNQPFSEAVTPGAEEEAPVDLSTLVNPDDPFPLGEILIFKPGPYSLLSSPFRISANVAPGPNNEVHIRLVGEDGRVLMQSTIQVYPFAGASTHTMGMEIVFEIQAMSELGRLEISVMDEFGRPKAMNSVDLILLSTGTSKRNYAGDLLEEVVINYPTSNIMVQGNSLLVSGLVRTRSEEPLKLELIDETGAVIVSADAAVLLPEDSEHGIFAGEIEYTVTTPTWVRLVISVPGERIPGTAYIKTIEVLIGP